MSQIQENLINTSQLHYSRSTPISPLSTDRVIRFNQLTTNTDPVDWEICESDVRILKKILRKDYSDCGRKRGAILRHIKHYKEVEQSQRSQINFARVHKALITNKTNF